MSAHCHCTCVACDPVGVVFARVKRLARRLRRGSSDTPTIAFYRALHMYFPEDHVAKECLQVEIDLRAMELKMRDRLKEELVREQALPLPLSPVMFPPASHSE